MDGRVIDHFNGFSFSLFKFSIVSIYVFIMQDKKINTLKRKESFYLSPEKLRTCLKLVIGVQVEAHEHGRPLKGKTVWARHKGR